MDAEGGLKALFEPVGTVSVKRMFGGRGVYLDGLCFAVESGGEVYLKGDDQAKTVFADAGSAPFIYCARGKPMTTSYWRLLASAYEATQIKPQLESLSLGRFALIAMTESCSRGSSGGPRPHPQPSVLGFDLDGARRTGGA
jgi:DNA transformation protein and related proteins